MMYSFSYSNLAQEQAKRLADEQAEKAQALVAKSLLKALVPAPVVEMIDIKKIYDVEKKQEVAKSAWGPKNA